LTPRESGTDELVPAVHRWLLRLVGQVPDEALWAGRDVLFAGQPKDLAARLERLADHAEDHRPVSAADLSVEPGADDDEAVRAVRASPDSVGLWACTVGRPFGAGRTRWYVAEAGSADGVLRLDRRLHERLSGQRPRPRVAVIGPRGPGSPVISEVLEVAPLIWARERETRLRIAPLFDAVDADGTVRGSVGPPLSPEESKRVLGYLMSAEVVLRAFRPGRDLLDEDRITEVSIDLRSDGRWVWSDATAYYLVQHNMRPADQLLEYLRSAGPRAPALTSVDYHRVVRALESIGQE
jgi:hypothetical protein